MKSTSDVLANHLRTFAEGNLEELLSDYAPDAVFFAQDGPRIGPAALRPMFGSLIAEFAKPGASFSLRQQSVHGDCAYIWWTAETVDNVYEMATDTFVVREGRIVAQSFTAEIISKRPV